MDDLHRHAAKVGAGATLRDLRLRRLNAELLKPSGKSPFSFELTINPSFEVDDHNVLYEIDYVVEAQDADAAEMFKVNVAYTVLYEVDSDELLDESLLGAFGDVSVLFHTYPYLRETLHTITGRFGLPPLVLDTWKNPMDAALRTDPHPETPPEANV